jgi:hypothetical protein
MNAGLSNLYTLKSNLLAPALVAATDYDARLALLGKGVAGAFEKFCNRKFARVAGATYICSADRPQTILDRYPVETITTVELKTDETTGWEVQTDFVRSLSKESAIVYWGTFVGDAYAELRFTFTGGYFWEQLEPTDGSYPTAQPSGSTALPDALQQAWLLQCKLVWETWDKIGDKISEVGSGSSQSASPLSGLELSPLVKDMLTSYRRFQLT